MTLKIILSKIFGASEQQEYQCTNQVPLGVLDSSHQVSGFMGRLSPFGDVAWCTIWKCPGLKGERVREREGPTYDSEASNSVSKVFSFPVIGLILPFVFCRFGSFTYIWFLQGNLSVVTTLGKAICRLFYSATHSQSVRSQNSSSRLVVSCSLHKTKEQSDPCLLLPKCALVALGNDPSVFLLFFRGVFRWISCCETRGQSLETQWLWFCLYQVVATLEDHKMDDLMTPSHWENSGTHLTYIHDGIQGCHLLHVYRQCLPLNEWYNINIYYKIYKVTHLEINVQRWHRYRYSYRNRCIDICPKV